MGEFYSKPAAFVDQCNQSGPPNSRSRENNALNSSNISSDHSSSGGLETLSRFQSGNQLPPNAMPPGSQSVSPDQIYAASTTNRNGRSDMSNNNNPFHPSPTYTGALTPEDMLAAAQLCSQLSPSQLNALATAYHHQQQQQQIQRSGGSLAGSSNFVHTPGITFAQALAAATSTAKASSSTISLGVHGSNYNPRLSQAPSTHSHSQKRPPSIQSQFHSGHSNQPVSNSLTARPASASQAALYHRNNHTIPPSFVHLNPHLNLPQPLPVSAHLDPNTLNLLSAHHQSRASPSLSPSPVNNVGYQGRRSQLLPPSSTHPTKRPRISTGSQQTHSVSSLPTGHNISTSAAAGMEALLNSVVAGKPMAGSNFMNPSVYSSATEAAAAAAFSPFYSLINPNNHSNTSTPNSTSNQSHFHSHLQAHHQRSSGGSSGNSMPNASHTFHHHHHHHQQQQQSHLIPSVSTYPTSHMPPLSVPLLNSLGTGRPSFPHGPGMPPQGLKTGQTNVSAASFGSQPNPNHQSVSHLVSKPSHSAAVTQNTSRLISGHLHHSHLPTHPTQHNFHHQNNHPLPQPNAQHHMMGHANLPQGSGVLRQQTKEPAYHPQVEAISPAPDESRLADAQDAKLHREREEINRQLTVLDADINKQESYLRNLCEREARLAGRLASTPTRRSASATSLGGGPPHLKGKSMEDISLTERNGPTSIETGDRTTDTERTYENPIQAIISDNRQRTRQRHLIFTRLCGTKVKPGPYALSLYRQPSDLPSIRAIQSEFRNGFRDKLIVYLKRRFRADQSRMRLLAEHYSKHSKTFTKKMDKILSSTKRRQRDLRYRDIFEKVLPEVKKNREDREMNGTDYPKSGIDDGDSNSLTGNLTDGAQTTPYDPIEEMSKFKEYAIDPPVILGPWQRRYQFVCESGLVTDCRAQLQEAQDLSRWSEEEKHIFKERFLSTPKNFVSIALHLERKTVAECIHYYYLSKKKEGYKQLLKKHNARRRRAAPAERGGGSGSGGNNANNNAGSSNTGGGTSGSGSGGGGNLPSASFSNGHSTITSPHMYSSLANDANDDNGTELVSNKHSYLSKNSHRKEMNSHASNLIAGSGLRTRPGRGRPPASHHLHSQNDDLGPTSNNTKGRGVNTSTTNSAITNNNNGLRTNNEQLNSQSLLTNSKELKNSDNSTPIIASKDLSIPNNLVSGSVQRYATPVAIDTIVSSSANMNNMVCANNNIVGNSDEINLDTTTDTNTNLSACIKDLIHFAIEKNLSKPSLNNGHNTNASSTTTRLKLTDNLTKNGQQVCGSQSFALGDNPSLNGNNAILANTNRDILSTKSGSIESRFVSVGQDQLENASPLVFPSTTAAEIYAAAARFAAASVHSGTLNSDMTSMYIMASVVAAANDTVTVNSGGRTFDFPTHPTSTCNSSGSGNDNLALLPSFHHSNPDQSTSLSDQLRKRTSTSCANPSWSNSAPKFANPVSEQQNNPMIRPTDAGSYSKAILIGDFLTAQQLGRTDSAGWNTTNPNHRLVPEHHAYRSIDPNTLPIPQAAPRSLRVSPCQGGGEGTHEPSRALSLFLEKSMTNDILAEHAIRLAMCAKAAETAASIGFQAGDPSHYDSREDNYSLSNTNNERCVYSPLSPTPIKSDDLNNSTCKTSPVLSQPINSRTCGPLNESAHSGLPVVFDPPTNTNSSQLKGFVKQDNAITAAQVASFVNNANKHYLEEVDGGYTSRDRSDSMRTLTSKEASQIYGVLQNLRQRGSGAGSPPQTFSTRDDGGGGSQIINCSFEQRKRCPSRPRSTETVKIQLNGSNVECDLEGAWQQLNLINSSRDQLLANQFCSPLLSSKATGREVHDDGNLFPNLKGSYISQDKPVDQMMTVLEAHYRRRGYTESQINMRMASASPVTHHGSISTLDSSASLAVANRFSINRLEPTNLSISVDNNSNRDVMTTFTTAKYIDALIHSHLDRPSRTTDDLPNVLVSVHPDSAEPNRNGHAGFQNMSQSLLGCTNSPDGIVPHSLVINSGNNFEAPIMSAPNLSTKRSSANTFISSTLENQINKAIAEEIRAQITPKSSNSSHTSNFVNHLSPHRSGTPPINHHAPGRTFYENHLTNSIVVPFKKRGERHTSHSPNSSATLTASPGGKTKISHFGSISTVGGGAMESVLQSNPANNYYNEFSKSVIGGGDSIRLDNHKQINDELCTDYSFGLDDRLSANSSRNNIKNSHEDDDNDTNNTRDNEMGRIISVSSVNPSETVINNHSPSSVSDVESPGQLQIDLAAVDSSPTIGPGEHSIGNSTFVLNMIPSRQHSSYPKHAEQSVQLLDDGKCKSPPPDSSSSMHLNCLENINPASTSATPTLIANAIIATTTNGGGGGGVFCPGNNHPSAAVIQNSSNASTISSSSIS